MADEAAPAEAAPPTASAGAAISEEEVSALLEKGPGNVRPFDLTAQRVNRTRLPALEAVCKALAEKIGPALTALVGRDATAHFNTIDSGKAVELQAALPFPAALAVIRLKPLPGSAFVSVEPALLLALLDGFFGGTGRTTNDVQAAVSPAAQRFFSLLLRNLAAGVASAFAQVTPIEMELVKLETNPRLMQLGAPQEGVFAMRFAVEFGAQTGKIDILMPESLVAPIREALAAENGVVQTSKPAAWAPIIGRSLHDAQVDTRAVLAQAKISLGELVRLKPGDIIPIEAPQHATLLAGDVELHHGRFGVSQGRNALKIIPGGPK